MVRWTDEDLANFKANSGRPIARAATLEIAKHRKIAALERRGAALLGPESTPKVGPKAVRKSAPAPVKKAGPNKYSAEPVVVDGIRFDSKLEARRYGELLIERSGGLVLYFLRQVPLHLPGGVIYRVDFMVARKARHERGAVVLEYEDCKGFQRQDSKNKIKQVRALYGIEVRLVKSARRRGSV